MQLISNLSNTTYKENNIYVNRYNNQCTQKSKKNLKPSFDKVSFSKDTNREEKALKITAITSAFVNIGLLIGALFLVFKNKSKVSKITKKIQNTIKNPSLDSSINKNTNNTTFKSSNVDKCVSKTTTLPSSVSKPSVNSYTLPRNPIINTLQRNNSVLHINPELKDSFSQLFKQTVLSSQKSDIKSSLANITPSNSKPFNLNISQIESENVVNTNRIKLDNSSLTKDVSSSSTSCVSSDYLSSSRSFVTKDSNSLEYEIIPSYTRPLSSQMEIPISNVNNNELISSSNFNIPLQKEEDRVLSIYSLSTVFKLKPKIKSQNHPDLLEYEIVNSYTRPSLLSPMDLQIENKESLSSKDKLNKVPLMTKKSLNPPSFPPPVPPIETLPGYNSNLQMANVENENQIFNGPIDIFKIFYNSSKNQIQQFFENVPVELLKSLQIKLPTNEVLSLEEVLKRYNLRVIIEKDTNSLKKIVLQKKGNKEIQKNKNNFSIEYFVLNILNGLLPTPIPKALLTNNSSSRVVQIVNYISDSDTGKKEKIVTNCYTMKN